MIGRTILHYEVIEKLGEGGMGVVYRARDTHLDRFVAIKVLPPEKVADPQRKARFVQEAKAASALNHPNIVHIYDIDQQDGADYIAMEYVAGKTLDQLIPRKGMRLNDALKYAIQITDALSRAHSAGIVHRDLKPSNVMVDEHGLVKVLDFGLAKLAERGGRGDETATMGVKTEEGTIVGTVAYMSPEQAQGKAIDARSDIFSFGSLLYEMVTGRCAFQGETRMSTLAAIITQEPTPLGGEIPHDLERVIARCLRKEPERRTQHMGDVKLALEEIRDAPEPAERPAPPARSRALPMVAACVAAGALLALAARAWLTDNHSVDLSSYRFIPFATALSVQSSPAWSPDGQSIAFSGTVEGTNGLFVQRVDAPAPHQIKLPFSATWPFWGPDSSSLYVVAPTGLWKVSAAGGEPVLIQPDSGGATVSPDGHALVFLRRGRDPPSFEVWVASPPNAKPRPYEPAPFMATRTYDSPNVHFAPDGRKIILAANPDGRGDQIWLLPWPAGPPRRILADLPLFGTPYLAWMPDSRHVLLSAATDTSQTNRLFMADLDSGRWWPVLAESRFAGASSVSPDGTKVVYTSELSQHDVVEAPLDVRPVRILLGSVREESMPSFSPSGRALVYVTNRRGEIELWLESLSERWARPLVTPSDFHLSSGRVYRVFAPVFSPDAQQIAFVATNRAGARLFVSGVAGSAPVRVTTEEVTEYAPNWSPDGQWIVYLRQSGRLTKARVGTSQPPIDLLGTLVVTLMPEWSPTGEWIACTVSGRPGITLVSPDGKNTRFLPGESAPLAWSRDSKTIYQVRGANNCSLVAVDVATGQERVLRELGGLCPSSFLFNQGVRVTLAPDGKSLAWAVNRARSELWILEGLRTPRPWFQRLLGTHP